MHAPLARRAGVADAVLTALRERLPLPLVAEQESVVISLGLEFFQTHHIRQATSAVALAQFGPQGLTELTTLMGFYAMLAPNANTVDLGSPLESAEPLLPV